MFNKKILKKLEEIENSLASVLAGQRMSTILEISPKSLILSSERFEANKEILQTRLLHALSIENHPQMDTRAFCILNHSGWDSFVDGTTRLRAQNALARLLVNDDIEGAKAFLNLIVDQL